MTGLHVELLVAQSRGAPQWIGGTVERVTVGAEHGPRCDMRGHTGRMYYNADVAHVRVVVAEES